MFRLAPYRVATNLVIQAGNSIYIVADGTGSGGNAVPIGMAVWCSELYPRHSINEITWIEAWEKEGLPPPFVICS